MTQAETISELRSFFAQHHDFPTTEMLLSDGCAVREFRQFGEMHLREIDRGHKWKGEYIRRLQEIRVRVMYCKR